MTESIASPTPSSMPGAVMAQSAPAALSVRQVAKTFGARGALTHALNGITFDIDKGEFVAIMGPSGSGKTTLLNCVSTIDRPTSGQILVDGRDITSLPKRALTTFRRDELGFIFQDFNLLDTLTARENIALALTIKHVPPAEVAARTQDIASVLGVAAVLDKYPGQMSGGQKQRVAAARAIVGNPALILADEPTGALALGIRTPGHALHDEPADAGDHHDGHTRFLCGLVCQPRPLHQRRRPLQRGPPRRCRARGVLCPHHRGRHLPRRGCGR